MQQFLKSAARIARARVVTTELFDQPAFLIPIRSEGVKDRVVVRRTAEYVPSSRLTVMA